MGPPGSNLPPPPESLDEGSIEPLELPPPLLPDEETPTEVVTSSNGSDTRAATEGAGDSGPATVPEPTDTAQAAVAVQESEASPGEKAAETGTQPTLSGWVVQVGSFGREANALALRDRLRAKGYTAFVEKARTGKGLVFRVRVGPELERENAERLQTRLSKDFGLKAIVTRYP